MSGRIVYQPPGSKACLGCVAAMITGEELADVAAHVGHDGTERTFLMVEVAGYLARKGYIMGAFASSPNIWRLDCKINASWPIDARALLIVASQCGKGNHAVYWTGWRVLDPENTNSERKLRDYKILEWWPVIEVLNGKHKDCKAE